MPARWERRTRSFGTDLDINEHTPNLPTNIVPTNIARLNLSVKSPMDMRIPPL